MNRFSFFLYRPLPAVLLVCLALALASCKESETAPESKIAAPANLDCDGLLNPFLITCVQNAAKQGLKKVMEGCFQSYDAFLPQYCDTRCVSKCEENDAKVVYREVCQPLPSGNRDTCAYLNMTYVADKSCATDICQVQ